MPIVNVKLMEGVLSRAQKKALLQGITDAVVKVYGPPMRLFMHVVLEEIKDGDWMTGGSQITPARVRAISPNVAHGARTARGAAARSRAGGTARGRRPAAPRR